MASGGGYGALRIIVTADTKGLGSQIASDAENIGTRAGQTIGQKISTGLAGFGSKIGSALSTGFVVAGTAAAAFGLSVFRTGVEYNTLEQTARAAFSTILGSSDAANKMMDQIAEFGKSSPFPRQAFIEGTQQMLAFGFSAERVIPTLGAVQDAVAATGGGAPEIGEIVRILSQIQSTGKISADVLNQLGYRGINAAKLIGDQMGMTEAQIRDSITNGSLDGRKALEALITGMETTYAGAAANVKNTWSGTTDRIKGAMRDLGSAMAEPFVSKTGGGLAIEWGNKLADMFRAIIPQATALAGQIGGALAKAGSAVAPVLDKILNFIKNADFGSLAKSFAPVAALFGAKGIGNIAGMLGPLGKLIPVIAPIPAAIIAIVATTPELREAFGRILAAFAPVLPIAASMAGVLGGAFSSALSAVTPLIVKLADGLAFLVGTFPGATTGVIAFAAGFGPVKSGVSTGIGLVKSLAGAVTGIGPGFVSAIGSVKTFATGFATVAKTIGSSIYTALGPVGLIIAGVVALGAAIVVAYKKFEPFRNVVDAVGRALLTAGQWVGGVVMSAFRGLVTVLTSVVSVGKTVASWLGGAFSTAWSGIVTAVGAVGRAFSTVWDGLSSAVGIVSGIVGKIINVITFPFQGLIGVIKGITNVIVGIFTGDFGKVKDGLGKIFDGLLQLFFGFPILVITALAKLGPMVWSWISGVFSNLTSAIVAGLTAAVTWFAGLPGRVLSALSSLGSSIMTLARSALTSMVSSITAGLTSAVTWFSGLPGRAVSALSSLGSSIMSTARSALSSMGSAITAGIASAVSFFASLPGRAVGALGSLGGSIMGVARSALSSMGSAVSGGISTVMSFFSQLPGRAVSALSSLPGQLLSVGRSALSSMASGVSSGIGSLMSIVGSIPGRVVSALGNIGGRMVQIGSAITQGIISGIGDVAGMIWSRISGGLSGLVAKAKGALGIASPSKVFRDEVGKPITQGILVGITSQQHELEKALTDLLEPPTLAAVSHAGVTAAGAAYDAAAGLSAGSAEDTELLRRIARLLAGGTQVEIDGRPVATAVATANLYGVAMA